MTVSVSGQSLSALTADAIAFLFHEEAQVLAREKRAIAKLFGSDVLSPFAGGDFAAKEGEVAVVYQRTKKAVVRILLVGLGKAATKSPEPVRRASALAARQARTLKASSLAIVVPPAMEFERDSVVGLVEGALLGLYQYNKYITKKKEPESELTQLVLAGLRPASLRKVRAWSREAEAIAEAACFARDLSNAPGNELYPQSFAQSAQESAGRNGFEVKVLDEVEIAGLGMGGVLGVSQGSSRPPRFLILEYGPKKKRPVVLVGKGVTFDSGGISIKPSAGMAEMKMDMSGAAAVLGTFQSVAQLRLPVHVVGLIPAVENMPGGNSLRPGDILRHHNGQTSEVDNTDAEGRLILADALSYATKYQPSAIIDIATLTGACVVALGHHATGMMGTDEQTMERLRRAGERTYERVWPLPIFEEYEKLIKSDVADVKNTGGRWAGAITAALFLKRFVGKCPWVHLDIAGTAILEDAGPYSTKGGSGIGVRLLTEYLRSLR